VPQSRFIVRALRADDDLKKLSLGNAEHTPLKTFLRRHACKYEERHLTRTYVLVEEAHAQASGRVWGYLTLVASEVSTSQQTRPQGEVHWPDEYSMPAVKLARMAIDKTLQGQRYGKTMLEWAIALIKNHVACHVGCPLIVTDAKQSAVGFYQKSGFTLIDTQENKKRDAPVMFINLSKL
jgi:GNAT superfamily N-acetyltransferase